jgi:immunity protein Imm5 of predicted polymorphic toxin system
VAELPEDLRAQLAHARAVLDARDDGELPLPERQAIRERLGPFEPVDAQHAPAGLRRRVKRAELAARRVLPLWYADRPDDDEPERLLALAHDVLDRRVERDEARREAHRFLNRMQELEDLSDNGASAAEAARNVVRTAYDGDYSDRTTEPSEETIEPSEWDPTFMASLAAAGYPDESVDKRRAYWEWYLDEAVPEAWSSG